MKGMKVDLLIRNAAQIATPTGPGPARGGAMGFLRLISGGAVAIREGRVVAIGPTSEVEAQIEEAAEIVEARHQTVIPGFVDPHTHLIWAGDRVAEFELRLKGATYLEILQAGGGILSTVRATRAASAEQLMVETRSRLDRMLLHGTTTAEAKTGYGLEWETERRLLEVLHRLNGAHPMDLVPTFMGAHAVPEEYQEDPEAYVERLIEEMLPEVAAQRYPVDGPWSPPWANGRAAWFCDVFCERGAFDLDQTRRILEAAKALGFGLKVHADEFEPALGATPLAVQLRAISVDHLVSTPPEHLELLARSETIGVMLPGTPFGLATGHYGRGRSLIDAGGALAIATDLNPGTSWCESMPMMIALATRYMKLTPAEALTAATLNAACAIGLGHEIGSLEPGKQADLVLLDAPDYRHLAYRYGVNLVHTVVKRGRIVVREGRIQYD
ncbi:MAG: imidazolonepropionase [Thermoflexus sp.]|uniref:imidazolonepropionase n=1 Tax=Thermoflexus sp. TaxID=1969742 RepID=UPI0025E4A313|nr:imidazolonepropionase [Thermoflexus sp.]MCS6962914.1 imidazolonepropionase [Thermoflexus sp.]